MEESKQNNYRFDASEVQRLRQKFMKQASKGGEIDVDNFKTIMGILGLESASFLATRIFKAIDKSGDKSLSFDEFLQMMDTLVNGTSAEKHEFGFRILDINNNGLLEYDEFKEAITQIVNLWYTMTGNNIRMDETVMRYLFERLDEKGNGELDLAGYKKIMETRADIIPWFEILNYGMDGLMPNKAKTRRLEKMRTKTIQDAQEMNTVVTNLRDELKNIKTNENEEGIQEWNQQQKSKLIEKLNYVMLMSEQISKEKPTSLSDVSLSMEEGTLEEHKDIEGGKHLGNLHKHKLDRTRTTKSNIENVIKNKGKAEKSFVNIIDEDWSLVLNMMLGIRNAVRSIKSGEIVLEQKHFWTKNNFELIHVKSGDAKKTSINKFIDYAPYVFHKIRNMYGMSDEEYLQSIGIEQLIGNLLIGNLSSLQEQSSTSKSGSFFYYSPCGRFLMKTLQKTEFNFLWKILHDYYNHLVNNPNSLLTRYYGIHQLIQGKKVNYFIIMSNSFNTPLEIDVRYDLKGSTRKRKVRTFPGEQIDSRLALKDLDLLEDKLKIKLVPELSQKFGKQLDADAGFMHAHNVFDYSFLLGIHRVRPGDKGDIPRWNREIQEYIARMNTKPADKGKNRPKSFLEINDGGLVDREGEMVYFMGMIDLLVNYSGGRKMEYCYKKMRFGQTASCLPPGPYAERFVKFLKAQVQQLHLHILFT